MKKKEAKPKPKKEEKIEYYTLDAILKQQAQYNVIFGQRSNGKTYAVLTHILDVNHDTGKQGALIRRYLDDIMPSKIETIFNQIIKNGYVKKLWADSDEGWDGIKYFKRKFFLTKTIVDKDGNKTVVLAEKPFLYVFAITEEEDYKENSYPDVTIIFFDEFLSRRGYLTNEFISFCNIVSTIKRLRTDVTIFMVGNTISQYCPYFTEMGIKHASKIPIGSIEVYSYGQSKLKVAVQRAENVKKNGKVMIDDYFAFDNPRLKMITQGEWELDIYPHAPDAVKWRPMDIRFIYFIDFDEMLYQCEIINVGDDWFTYIHRKTTPIHDVKHDLIFTKAVKSGYNYRQRLTRPRDYLGQKILWFFANGKVFYQDNEVGDAIANYIYWSNNEL